ncbi:hypothetical protein ES332_A11G209700v1 [Gossypium tomentosum]|uniref:Uncharacterized protein n=1 Tax=Gossypium tomentosum TaxID=34277 RepID=A0A5D2NEI2_GOSTO|nr:hypothetical protein ES332_A11G209700v1 [Gossypium tomentosum]
MLATKPDGSCSPSFFPMNSSPLTFWIGTMLGKVSNSCRYFKWLGKTTEGWMKCNVDGALGFLFVTPLAILSKACLDRWGSGWNRNLLKSCR